MLVVLEISADVANETLYAAHLPLGARLGFLIN